MSTTVTPTPTASAPPEPTSSKPWAVALRAVGIALAVLLVAWAATQAVDWAAATEGEQRLSYDAADTVELVADGAVTVRTGQSAGVDVRREWREGLVAISYDAAASADRLVVTHRCPWFSSTCRAALDVTVPADTNIVIRSSSGQIDVAGVAGDLTASTGSGSITIERIGGDVVANTGSGRVVAHEVGGDARLKSSSGDVEASAIGGSLDARTSSGRVEARDVGGEAFTHTSSGDVIVAAVASHIDARTSSGRVTVHGNGVPVALDIDTSSGSQTIEAPTDPAAPVTVKIRSSSGSVAYLAPLP